MHAIHYNEVKQVTSVTNMPNHPENITQLIQQWMKGDASVESKLINAVYPLLRDIAHIQINKAPSFDVHTTAIVNELYIKLKKQNRITINDKNHFLAFSARLIRQIILDSYRSNNSLKRGQLHQHITLNEENLMELSTKDSPNIDWITLDKALNELEEIDPDSAKLIELRFFAGLNISETAKLLNTSPSSISRNWKFAKSWLMNRLKDT